MSHDTSKFLIIPFRQLVSDLTHDFVELGVQVPNSDKDLIESICHQTLDELLDDYIYQCSRYLGVEVRKELTVQKQYGFRDDDPAWVEFIAVAWDMVYAHMQLLIDTPTWNVIYKKVVGSSVVIELGEDYRVIDWTRRMESGEWHE